MTNQPPDDQQPESEPDYLAKTIPPALAAARALQVNSRAAGDLVSACHAATLEQTILFLLEQLRKRG